MQRGFFAQLPEVSAQLARFRDVLKRALRQAKGAPIPLEIYVVTPAPEATDLTPEPSYGFHSPAPDGVRRLPSMSDETRAGRVDDALETLRYIALRLSECSKLVSKIADEIEKRRV